jgi:hypothetical protein
LDRSAGHGISIHDGNPFDLATGSRVRRTFWPSVAAPTVPIAMPRRRSEGRRGLGQLQAKASTTPATPTPALQQLRQSTQFASTAPALPQPGFCWFYWGTEYYNIPEHFLNTETYGGNIPETVTEGTNSSTTATLGIGYSWSGASGTWGASGTASITDSATYGVSSTFSTTHSVYNRVNYRDLRGTCGGVYREPYSFYDLLSADGGSVGITWQYNCSPHYAGDTWYSGGATDATVGGGVNLGVLSVSAQQGYGTSIQLRYRFNVSGQVCGNSSSGPLQSSLLEADPF